MAANMLGGHTYWAGTSTQTTQYSAYMYTWQWTILYKHLFSEGVVPGTYAVYFSQELTIFAAAQKVTRNIVLNYMHFLPQQNCPQLLSKDPDLGSVREKKKQKQKKQWDRNTTIKYSIIVHSAKMYSNS
jgi:hypothetical protein